MIIAQSELAAIGPAATWATAVVAAMIFGCQVLTLLQALLKARVDRETAAAALAAAADAKKAAEGAAVEVKEVRKELATTGSASVQKLDAVKDELSATGEATVSRLTEVKNELITTGAVTSNKLNELLKVGAQTLIHVNSGRGEQLKIAALALRRVVDMKTPAHPDDVAAAELAEKLYEEHMAGQAHIDQAMRPGGGG